MSVEPSPLTGAGLRLRPGAPGAPAPGTHGPEGGPVAELRPAVPADGAAAEPPPGPAAELRPAVLADVEAMARMINGYAALGLMLPKTPAALYRCFREYVVVVDADGSVAACGGLRVYGPHLAEIVSLAVREDRRGRGYGAEVVKRLLDDARAMGIDAVFAMTLEPAFFRGRGFEPVSRARLPEKVTADCRGCARRGGCTEIAMLRRLAVGPERPVRSERGRPLRVV